MGAQGLTDVTVEGGQVHQVLFASLLKEGPPCLVLVLSRLIRLYSLCSSGGSNLMSPLEASSDTAGEMSLHFLSEMHLDCSILHAAVIPCSRKGSPSAGPLCRSDGAEEASLCRDEGSALCTHEDTTAANPFPPFLWGLEGPSDLLLLLFAGYRTAVVCYDEALGALRTLSMHCFAELGPRAAAINAFLLGSSQIKLTDEGVSSMADEGGLGMFDEALTIAAGQLPLSVLRNQCKALVFPLETHHASDSPGRLHGGRHGRFSGDVECAEFLIVLCLDLLHLVCLQISVQVKGPRTEAALPASSFASAAAHADAPAGAPNGSFLKVDRSHLLRPPCATPLPPSSVRSAAPHSWRLSLSESPWCPGEGTSSSAGASFRAQQKGLLSAKLPRFAASPVAGQLSSSPPVAFLGAAVQQQQLQLQHQIATESSSIEGVSGASAAGETGLGGGAPSLWGAHDVLDAGLSVSSCFFFSLVTGIPLPPAASAAVANTASSNVSAVAGDPAAASAAAHTAAAAAGAAGLPYVLLDMIPSLLGDTFRLLSVPEASGGILCLSPNTVSFFSFHGGYCGGGSQHLTDSQQQYTSSSGNCSTLGITHILHPAGLVRKDLQQMPSVVFDKSCLRLRLEGDAAGFVRNRCLFLLAADGRPALAHLVMPAGLGVTDFLWTSVEVLSPTANAEMSHWGASSLSESQEPLSSETLTRQLLLPRSDSLAVWHIEDFKQQVASNVPSLRFLPTVLPNNRSADSSRCLLAFGGRIREGTGVCLAIAEPLLVATPQAPWGGAPGASCDIHCGPTSLLGDEATGTGTSSLEICCSRVSELSQGRGQQQQQQQQELYTSDGKQLMEILPDGSIAVAQQRAPILRHSELKDEESPLFADGEALAAPASLALPRDYLRWLRTQQNIAAQSPNTVPAVAGAAQGAAAAPETDGFSDASTEKGGVGATVAILAAAAAVLNSSSNSGSNRNDASGKNDENAQNMMTDALGLVRDPGGGHPLLRSVRLRVCDRLGPQGLLAPRCVAYLPLRPLDLPVAAAGEELHQQHQQAVEAFCSSSGCSRFILAGGSWPHGSLGALQRAVPCRPLVASTVVTGTPRILWAVQQQQNQHHQEHGLLLVSSDPRMGLGESRLLCLREGALVDETLEAVAATAKGSESVRTTGGGLSLEAPTLFAACLLGGLVMLQLTAEELRVLDASGSFLLCCPIDMNEAPQQHEEMQDKPQQAIPSEAQTDLGGAIEESVLKTGDESLQHPAELDMDGNAITSTGLLETAEAAAAATCVDCQGFAEGANARWEGEQTPKPSGGIAAAVRGSAAGNWVCVVLDDFRLRLWHIDAAAAVAALKKGPCLSSVAANSASAPLLHEILPSAMPRCMRGRIKSAQLYEHPGYPAGGEEGVYQKTVSSGGVFCCLVTLEGCRNSQALHVVSLQHMQCVFSSVDLRLVSPVLRNCGSCAEQRLELQLRQKLLHHLQQHPILAAGELAVGGNTKDVIPGSSLVSFSQTEPEVRMKSGGTCKELQEKIQQYATAAAAALAREGLRDAGRSITCITAAPLSWESPSNETGAAASAARALAHVVPAAESGDAQAAEAGCSSEAGLPAVKGIDGDLTEEVLSAELLPLDPVGDAGPTLVIFLTGRPPLVYRAFCRVGSPVTPVANFGAVSARNCFFAQEEALGESLEVPCFDLGSLVASGDNVFPWSFRLVTSSCAYCIPSRRRLALRGTKIVENRTTDATTGLDGLSVHFAVSSGYTTVPQQAPLWGGGVALVIPPLPLPETSTEQYQQHSVQQPPVLWLCSRRNQLYIHPNERRDALGAAAFCWVGGPPNSFAFLYEQGPVVCLADVASPFENACSFPSTAASQIAVATLPGGEAGAGKTAATYEASKTMGPFRLDGPIPFSAFPLGASATHVAVSSGSSYMLPSEAEEAAAPEPGRRAEAKRTSATGRLVAVALQHLTEEMGQIRDVLETRNALQRAHVALQSRAGTAAAATTPDSVAYDDGGGAAGLPPHLPPAGTSNEASPGVGKLLPNPYLAACADGRVEVTGEVGKQYEVLLFHQDNLIAPLGCFLLSPCEVVMSLQFVMLDALEFLAVGVSQPLSEGVDVGGRLLLLHLPALLSYGKQPAAAGSGPTTIAAAGNTSSIEEDGFGLFCSFAFPGPVSTVGDFAPSAAERHYLLHSVGRRLFIHEMDGDLLARGAFADVGATITSVSTLKHFVVAGDLYKGITLLAWRFDPASDSRRLELVCRTVPHYLLSVTACDALTEGDTLGLIAADPWGNIRFFSINQATDAATPICQQLQVLRCDSESMECQSPVVAFKQLLTERGDIACAAWSAEGGLLSVRLVDAETAELLRALQGWLEMCLPSECGVNLTAARVPAGLPSVHLRLWAAENQLFLQQQLQQLLQQQYPSSDEQAPAEEASTSAPVPFSWETVDLDWLLLQLEGNALAALRSYMPVSSSLLRAFPYLSVPVQQRLEATASPSLLSLLQSHPGASIAEGARGARFPWAALRDTLAKGPLRGLDLPAVPPA
ncbi:hypothetical protein Efla_003286 [Eimeria flavescens]